VGNTRGDDEAYSRVTRDLAQVTAAFKEHMEALPERLTRSYECFLRDLDDDERARLHVGGTQLTTRTYAVDPGDPECAVLLVREGIFEGGLTVTLAVGRTTDVLLPECFCDACHEDSGDLIEVADRIADLARVGFHEFRRPYVPQPDDGLLCDPPWLQEGYETADGSGESRAGHNVTGELFSVDWRPWRERLSGR
jgi:Family of unknown function (DUF6226)